MSRACSLWLSYSGLCFYMFSGYCPNFLCCFGSGRLLSSCCERIVALPLALFFCLSALNTKNISIMIFFYFIYLFFHLFFLNCKNLINFHQRRETRRRARTGASTQRKSEKNFCGAKKFDRGLILPRATTITPQSHLPKQGIRCQNHPA